MGQKKKKKNPMRISGPFYVAAGIWLAWSLMFPLKGFVDFFLCTLLSAGGFGVGLMFWPKYIDELEEEPEENTEKKDNEVKQEPEKKAEPEPEKVKSTIDEYRAKVKKRKRTGDATIDKMLDDEELALAEMLRLDDAIEDEKVSAQIVHLEEVTTKIVDFVYDHRDKKNSVRRFFNYYLPTTLKLLNAYDRMDETGISGVNIDGTKGKVEVMMDTSLAAFDKQLDALYADEALDISLDIKVMENMLSNEGLKDDEITNILNLGGKNG